MPSTAVMDMSGVSAVTSVSIVVVARADKSLQILRVEALSPSNSPTTSLSLASLNLTFDEDIQFGETRTVDLCTNSGVLEMGARMQNPWMEPNWVHSH